MFLVNNAGKTALDLAVSAGHWEIVKKVIEHRRFKWNNVDFQELIWEAVRCKHYLIACKLLILQPGFKFKDPNIPIYLERCRTLTSNIEALNPTHPNLARKKRDLEIYQKHLATLLNTEKSVRGSLSLNEALEERDSDPLEDLLCLLECPICMEEMLDVKIIGCNNDHWLCESCFGEGEIRECPTCRQDFQQTPPQKKYSAEKVAAVVLRLKVQFENANKIK